MIEELHFQNATIQRVDQRLERTRQLTTASNLPQSDERLIEAAQEFEALFVEQMLDTMRKTIDRSHNPLHGGIGQDVFEDMLFSEYARVIAKQGDLGISRIIYNELRTK